jgi:hypothetical protein
MDRPRKTTKYPTILRRLSALETDHTTATPVSGFSYRLYSFSRLFGVHLSCPRTVVLPDETDSCIWQCAHGQLFHLGEEKVTASQGRHDCRLTTVACTNEVQLKYMGASAQKTIGPFSPYAVNTLCLYQCWLCLHLTVFVPATTQNPT